MNVPLSLFLMIAGGASLLGGVPAARADNRSLDHIGIACTSAAITGSLGTVQVGYLTGLLGANTAGMMLKPHKQPVAVPEGSAALVPLASAFVILGALSVKYRPKKKLLSTK